MPTTPENFHIGRDTWGRLKNLYGLLNEYLKQLNQRNTNQAGKEQPDTIPEVLTIATSADAHRVAATDSAVMLEDKVRAGRKLTDDASGNAVIRRR